jgi:hypothetical protein
VPETFSQIVLLVVFIIPGFILMRVKRVSYPPSEYSAQSTILDSLALSCVIHGLASPVWYWSYVSRVYLTCHVLFGVQVFMILFAVPVLLGILFNVTSRTKGMRWLREFLYIPHPDPTAWDHHFRKGRAYWVWLTFKSGQVMAGLFGPSSFASSFPHQQDLYVEKLLALDSRGKVIGWKGNSAGALIRMENLERVEFLDIEEVNP